MSLAKDSSKKIERMVVLAFLAALEVILMLFPITVGTVSLNFGLVPIVIAGVLFGPAAGAAIGGVSGIVTMIQVLTGQSYFYMFLVAVNPWAASAICVIKTVAAGLLSGLVYKLFCKFSRFKAANVIASAIVCPVVNTGLFALGMFVFFGKAMMSDDQISTWANGGVIAVIFLALIGVNFFVELALNIVVCPVVSKALFTFRKTH